MEVDFKEDGVEPKEPNVKEDHAKPKVVDVTEDEAEQRKVDIKEDEVHLLQMDIKEHGVPTLHIQDSLSLSLAQFSNLTTEENLQSILSCNPTKPTGSNPLKSAPDHLTRPPPFHHPYHQ